MIQFEAMLLSMAIEAPIAFAIVLATRWPSRGAWHVALAAIVATAVTHPQLWMATLWLEPRLSYWSALGIGEAAVVLIEAAVIAWATGLTAVRSLIVSAATNGASAAVGIVLLV